MPLYEFACDACKTVYEELLSIGSGFDCPQCGKPAQRLISAPAMHTDGNLTPMERTAAFLEYGRDPSSRAELKRMRRESGKPLRVGVAERESDGRKETKPFQLSEDERRDAVGMVRANRSRGALDSWRMEYTKDRDVIAAGESAAKELAKNGRR